MEELRKMATYIFIQLLSTNKAGILKKLFSPILNLLVTLILVMACGVELRWVNGIAVSYRDNYLGCILECLPEVGMFIKNLE